MEIIFLDSTTNARLSLGPESVIGLLRNTQLDGEKAENDVQKGGKDKGGGSPPRRSSERSVLSTRLA